MIQQTIIDHQRCTRQYLRHLYCALLCTRSELLHAFFMVLSINIYWVSAVSWHFTKLQRQKGKQASFPQVQHKLIEETQRYSKRWDRGMQGALRKHSGVAPDLGRWDGEQECVSLPPWILKLKIGVSLVGVEYKWFKGGPSRRGRSPCHGLERLLLSLETAVD